MSFNENCLNEEQLCKVCGAPASKRYYGVLCCLFCGDFFCYSVCDKKEYQCATKKCARNLERLLACNYCRYEKCLDVGMKPDQVTTPHETKKCFVCGKIKKHCIVCSKEFSEPSYNLSYTCKTCAESNKAYTLKSCPNGGKCKVDENPNCKYCYFKAYSNILNTGFAEISSFINEDTENTNEQNSPNIDQMEDSVPSDSQLIDEQDDVHSQQYDIQGTSSVLNSNIFNYYVCNNCSKTVTTPLFILEKTKEKKINVVQHCQVCNSTNRVAFHYGAVVCEACHQFFRTYMKGEQRIACYSSRFCQSITEPRRLCKYCRFQACLRAGMAVSKFGSKKNLRKEAVSSESEQMFTTITSNMIINTDESDKFSETYSINTFNIPSVSMISGKNFSNQDVLNAQPNSSIIDLANSDEINQTFQTNHPNLIHPGISTNEVDIFNQASSFTNKNIIQSEEEILDMIDDDLELSENINVEKSPSTINLEDIEQLNENFLTTFSNQTFPNISASELNISNESSEAQNQNMIRSQENILDVIDNDSELSQLLNDQPSSSMINVDNIGEIDDHDHLFTTLPNLTFSNINTIGSNNSDELSEFLNTQPSSIEANLEKIDPIASNNSNEPSITQNLNVTRSEQDILDVIDNDPELSQLLKDQPSSLITDFEGMDKIDETFDFNKKENE